MCVCLKLGFMRKSKHFGPSLNQEEISNEIFQQTSDLGHRFLEQERENRAGRRNSKLKSELCSMK